MDRIRTLISVPQPLRDLILTAETLARLQSFADVELNEDGHDWTGPELAGHLPGVEVLITGWGICPLTADVLASADRLRLIAHAAGSVKHFVTDAVFARGIAVTHAAARIAQSVAEYTLLAALMGLRRLHDLDRQMKAGEAWPPYRELPRYEIAGKRVGLLGMGYVGRLVSKLFQAVGAEVWAYDPYLSAEQAAVLGVRKAGLHELLASCLIVSDHLPVTDETRHLLGAAELALLQGGAVFVNSARAWTVDQDALVQELATGRFWAALDVFDPEPLPLDHPLRRLDNVLLTPHVAGASRDALQGLVAAMVDEIERFANGDPLNYRVTRDMLATMA
ncbi:MAG: hydroxyacid dehydrogenase [Anaerolineae bacterium]